MLFILSYESGSNTWKDVSSCVETALTSCDVTEYGCARLRVRAHSHNLTSTPEEACSRLGDSCSPSVDLRTQPGILSVILSSNHTLMLDHRFAKYRVYYGLEDLPLEEYEIHAPDSRSSVIIKRLDEGKSYCVYVQIVLYDKKDVGPPSCRKCMVIPESDEKLQQVKIIAAVSVVIILVVLSVVTVYVLLYQQKRINRIKQWLKPEPLPKALHPLPDHQRPLITITPQEDEFDRLSLTFTHEEQGLTSVQET